MAVKKTKKTLGAKLAADINKAKSEVAVMEKPKAARPKKAAPRKEQQELYVYIDYPTENEIVSGLHYAIRIGATETAGMVEISFDGGEWLPCRPAAGYWWHDWGYFTPGSHTIAARLRSEAGKTLKKADMRHCEVV